MASSSGGGFSKEQLALAKQLQSGYVNSGTFHSQGQGGPKGGSSLSAPRMPHATQPVRSQPPHLRAANGLVRPLPGNATHKAAMTTTGRPAPPVRPSAARPAPASTAPVAPAAPAASTVPPHLRASLQAARPITESTSTAGPAPPVQSMPANNMSYNRPPPMPTNLQPAMTPSPMFPAAITTAPKPAPATEPTTASNTASNTTSAPRPAQQSPNAQLLKTVLFAAHGRTASREGNLTPSQLNHRHDAVSKAVMQGIKINQSGKPIVWNWASEEPVARELTAAEIEQMQKSEPLPPMIYDRPFHENATMRAPGAEGKSEAGVEPPPRNVVGLKGSRHAY